MSKFLSLLLIGLSMSVFANDMASSAKVESSSIKNATDTTTANATLIVKISPCNVNSPCSAIRDTTQQVMDIINNPDHKNDMIAKVTAITVPKFDFRLMTKYALGSNWKMATTAQQNELVTLFQNLLIYTYSSAISKFKNAKFTLISETTKSIGESTDRTTAAVVSQVLLNNNGANAQPVKVEYDLVRYNNKPWMAYDIKIEDASLVTTYRNQFNDVVTSSKIDGLIKQLKTKIASLTPKAN